MTPQTQQAHDKKIIEQFTKQAIPFAELLGHLDSVQMLIDIYVGNNS